ncbi:uncharacterized protein LOC134692603 [Mytilus trossulus]|uniref:uncharacterized protein LOC134692603 n=1 Tax=Mytilus trossulus TaxID=6551 RepID=UPI0030040005
MKILFINAQSFKTAFGLHDIVEKYNIEILCVNETFEKPNSPIHFKDWKVYSSSRKDKTGGGSAIFIKPTLNFVTIRKPEYELDSIEMVCIEVKDRSNKTFNIWVPYVPPEKPKLMEELCNVVKKEKLKNLILLGDLNAKSMEWNNPKENSHGKLLENCMTTSNLICTNDGQYTRRNSSSRGKGMYKICITDLKRKLWNAWKSQFQKLRKKKFFAHRHPVWWDDAVKDSKKSLNQAQRKFKVKSTPNNFENLKQAEINFNKVKDLAQEEWGNNLAEKLSKASNVKDKWSVFRKMTKKQNNNMVLPFVDGNGNVTFKEEEKCQQLETTFFKGKHLNPISFDAEFYTEIMDKYHSISEDKEQHLEDNNDIDINFAIEQDERAGAVYRLKNETCPGPDNYFSLLFINGDDNLYSTLLYIMNKSWDEGSLPKSWKQANVKFIKKIGKPNYNNPSSYRPISLTSIYIY